jgi:hypothetical protein
MTRARYQQVSLQDTPYYHCISRCVRRAYLCGDDAVSGKNFDHRKQWLVTRIKKLAAHFSVEICAYAVMSNHYHLVLCVNQQQAETWTDDEVIRRWTALVTCMAYVDLNPVRAQLSDSLEGSDFTSIQERLTTHAKKVKHRSYRQHRLLTRRASKHLVGRQSTKQAKLKSLASQHGANEGCLPLTQQSYFDLLETTCKLLVSGDQPDSEHFERVEQKHQVFQELGIRTESWLRGVTAFHKYYSIAAGSEQSLVHFHRSRIKSGVDLKHPHKWIRGVQSARLLYGT